MRLAPQHIFPCVLIAIQLVAAAIYAGFGDWRRCVYWSAASVLNVAVTF